MTPYETYITSLAVIMLLCMFFGSVIGYLLGWSRGYREAVVSWCDVDDDDDDSILDDPELETRNPEREEERRA